MKAKKNNEQNEKRALTELKEKAKQTSKTSQPVAMKANTTSSTVSKPVLTKSTKTNDVKLDNKSKPVLKTSSVLAKNKISETPAIKSKTSNKVTSVENNKTIIKATNISTSKLINKKDDTTKSSLEHKKMVKSVEKKSKSLPTSKPNTAQKIGAVTKGTSNLKTFKILDKKDKPVNNKTDNKSIGIKSENNIESSIKPSSKLHSVVKTKPVQSKQPIKDKKQEGPGKPTTKTPELKSNKKLTVKTPEEKIKSSKSSQPQTKNVKESISKPTELAKSKVSLSSRKISASTENKKIAQEQLKTIAVPSLKKVGKLTAVKPVAKSMASDKVVSKPSMKTISKTKDKNEIINDKLENLEFTKTSETNTIKTEAKEKTRVKSKPEISEELPYTDEQLMFYKELLSKKREEFIQQVNGLRKKIKKALDQDNVYERNTGDPDSDYITESSEFAKDEILINRLEENIRDIDDALASIEDRTYGYCQKTGKLIEEERLKTIPWARYCIMIQNEIESSS